MEGIKPINLGEFMKHNSGSGGGGASYNFEMPKRAYNVFQGNYAIKPVDYSSPNQAARYTR